MISGANSVNTLINKETILGGNIHDKGPEQAAVRRSKSVRERIKRCAQQGSRIEYRLAGDSRGRANAGYTCGWEKIPVCGKPHILPQNACGSGRWIKAFNAHRRSPVH